MVQLTPSIGNILNYTIRNFKMLKKLNAKYKFSPIFYYVFNINVLQNWIDNNNS